MRTVLPFDELNTLTAAMTAEYSGPDYAEKMRQQKKKIDDDILEILILAYMDGVKAVNEMLGTDIGIDRDKMYDAITAKIGGKTAQERIAEYIEDGDLPSIIKVIWTEVHRDFVEAEKDTANEAADENGLDTTTPDGGSADDTDGGGPGTPGGPVAPGLPGVTPEQPTAPVIPGMPVHPTAPAEPTVVQPPQPGQRLLKTWATMEDDKVRDAHQYLDGITVPADAEFYTYDGRHAYGPGLFGDPELDINCRCWLEYKAQ